MAGNSEKHDSTPINSKEHTPVNSDSKINTPIDVKKEPIDIFLDTTDFKPEEKNIIKQLQQKGILPSLEELKNSLQVDERIKQDLKNRIERRNNPETIEDFFNTIEDKLEQENIAKALQTLGYGTAEKKLIKDTTKEPVQEIEIRTITKNPNANDEEILQKISLNGTQRTKKTLTQALKNKRVEIDLQQPQNLDENQGKMKNKVLQYFTENSKERSTLQEKLFNDKDVLNAITNFLTAKVIRKEDADTDEEKYYNEQEKLEFITSSRYEETLVHILNKRINQKDKELADQKETEEKDKIGERYISSNMEYRIHEYFRRKAIDKLPDEEVKKRELERLGLTTQFLREKSDIVSSSKEFKSADNAKKSEMVRINLKAKLETTINNKDSQFYGKKLREVLANERVTSYIQESIIRQLKENYPPDKNPQDNPYYWHDLTSAQAYGYLTLCTADTHQGKEININDLFNAKDGDFINMMMGKPSNSELAKRIAEAEKRNNAKFDHSRQKTGFESYHRDQQQRRSSLENYSNNKAQQKAQENLSIQDQVKSSTIGNLEGSKVLAANPKITAWLNQNGSKEFSKEINEKIKSKIKEKYKNQNSTKHIKDDLLEKGINPEHVLQNGTINADALFQEFIAKNYTPEQAQDETQRLIYHQQQPQIPKENIEKREEIREQKLREAEIMVQLEALGAVFDTIKIYLKASPKTENFTLEDINNIEIKDGSLIITGDINGVPISFGYNLNTGWLSTNRTVSHQNETYTINAKDPNYPLFRIKNFTELQSVGFDILEKKGNEIKEKIKQKNADSKTKNGPHKDISSEKREQEEEKMKSVFGEQYNPKTIRYEQQSIEDNVEKNKTLSYFTEIIQAPEGQKLTEFNSKTTQQAYEMLKNIDGAIHSSEDATLLKNTVQRILNLVHYREEGLKVPVNNNPTEKVQLTEEQQKDPAYQSEVLRSLFSTNKIKDDQKNLNNNNPHNSIFLLIDHFTDTSKPNEPKIKFNEMTNYINKMERGELEADKELEKTPSKLTTFIFELKKSDIERKDRENADRTLKTEFSKAMETYPQRGKGEGEGEEETKKPTALD